jgi:uncharacterized protein
MDRYQMLENIRAHSVVVSKVAHLIARQLRDAGYDISVELTTVASLLHDIGKTATLDSGEDHAEKGRLICLQNNLQEIADIVGEHVQLKNHDINEAYSEKGIVFYSDKRVNHDRIVSLEDRLDYLIDRYAKDQEPLARAIRTNFEFCKRVEKKLFGKLNFRPELLAEMAKNEAIGPVKLPN